MSVSYLRDDFSQNISGDSLFTWAVEVADNARPSDIYRSKEGRKPLRFDRDGQSYFLKIHSGVGWKEIIKNLLQLRLPILSARNEYDAVVALNRLRVDTLSVAAFSSEGIKLW